MYMEGNVNQKIKQILTENRYTQNQFAKEIGMNPTTLGRQLKGEQTMSASLIESFLSVFPDVSAEWLLRDEGGSSKSREAKKEHILLGGSIAAEEIHVNSDAALWKARYEELEKRYDQLIGVLGKGGV